MPHKYSLKNKKEIDGIFKQGSRRHARYLTIFYLPANENKFAFITPKKYIKLASHRNYTRRVLREITRCFLDSRRRTPKQYVFLCKTDLKELREKASFREIQLEILHALESIRP